jgi:hypothetical protein
MIVVVGIDQCGASRRDAVIAGRSERFSRGGACDRAETPSSVARVPSGGHDERRAGGQRASKAASRAMRLSSSGSLELET